MVEEQRKLKNIFKYRQDLSVVKQVILQLKKQAIKPSFVADLRLFEGVIDIKNDLLPSFDIVDSESWLPAFYDVSQETLSKGGDMTTEFLQESEYKIEVLLAALGLKEWSGMYSAYELTDMVNSVIKRMDEERFAHTLGQLPSFDERYRYKYALLGFLAGGMYNLKDCYTWEESLNVALAVRVLWTWLPFLPDEEIIWLCKNCYFLGMAFDLPIRKIIKNYLYHSATPIICVNRYKLITDALKQNIELAYFSNINKDVILDKFLESDTNKKEESIMTDIYNFYPELITDEKVKNTLSIAISLYLDLESLSLVDDLYVDEKNSESLLMRDTFVLPVEYINGSEQSGWNHIVDYYSKNNKPTFSLLNFLSEIKSHEDLYNDDTVKRVL